MAVMLYRCEARRQSLGKPVHDCARQLRGETALQELADVCLSSELQGPSGLYKGARLRLPVAAGQQGQEDLEIPEGWETHPRRVAVQDGRANPSPSNQP